MDIILNNSALITVFASEQNKMIQKLIILLEDNTRYIFCKKTSKDEKYDLSAVDSALLLINEI